MRRFLLLLGLSWSLIAGNCVQEHVVPYENPSEQYINITGTLDDGMTYVATVVYVKSAQESHCQDYDQKTGICRVKPQSFTYSPQIQNRHHRVHIPLKELSPGENSWWEPHDISLCVRPIQNPTHPYQCQPLFTLNKGHNAETSEINFVCSKDWRCIRKEKEIGPESIGELNREYVVNIRKQSPL